MEADLFNSVCIREGIQNNTKRKSNKQTTEPSPFRTWASLPKPYSAEGGAEQKIHINHKRNTNTEQSKEAQVSHMGSDTKEKRQNN